jgi:hypothetical protein
MQLYKTCGSSQRKRSMNTVQDVKRLVARALLSGGVAATALALMPVTAHARPAPAPTDCDPVCHGSWCPGDSLPDSTTPINWDMNSCHDYHQSQDGDILEGPAPSGGVMCDAFASLCPPKSD